MPSLASSLLPAGLVDVPTQGGEIVGVEGLVYVPSSPSCPYRREWKEKAATFPTSPQGEDFCQEAVVSLTAQRPWYTEF